MGRQPVGLGNHLQEAAAMTTPLFTTLASCAVARAHLAGAAGPCPRYWRELAAAAILAGTPWPLAQELGGKP